MAAALNGNESRPANWDKRVAAAYLRILGATQAEAARAVDRAERTLRDWESDDTWPAARAEAADRWLVDLTDASRERLLNTIRSESDSGALALKILERVDDRLLPPKHRVEHDGEVEHRHYVAEIPPVEDTDAWLTRFARQTEPSRNGS